MSTVRDIRNHFYDGRAIHEVSDHSSQWCFSVQLFFLRPIAIRVFYVIRLLPHPSHKCPQITAVTKTIINSQFVHFHSGHTVRDCIELSPFVRSILTIFKRLYSLFFEICILWAWQKYGILMMFSHQFWIFFSELKAFCRLRNKLS